MVDLETFVQQEGVNLCEFQKEVDTVYTEFVCGTGHSDSHWKKWGCVFTQYGYVMNCFGRFDLLSALWKGVADSNGARISDFLVRYLGREVEVCKVAVKMWRHKLMHLHGPRVLHDDTGKTFTWLLHWGHEISPESHFTLEQDGAKAQFRMGVRYLVQDVLTAQGGYFADLKTSPELKIKFARSMEEQEKKNAVT